MTSATRSSPTSAASSSTSRTGPSPGRGRAGQAADGPCQRDTVGSSPEPRACTLSARFPVSPIISRGQTGGRAPFWHPCYPAVLPVRGHQPRSPLCPPGWSLSSLEVGCSPWAWSVGLPAQLLVFLEDCPLHSVPRWTEPPFVCQRLVLSLGRDTW